MTGKASFSITLQWSWVPLSNVFRRNLSYNETPMFVRGISEQTNLVLWIRMRQSHCVCYNSIELLKALVKFISPAFSNRKLFELWLLDRSCCALQRLQLFLTQGDRYGISGDCRSYLILCTDKFLQLIICGWLRKLQQCLVTPIIKSSSSFSEIFFPHHVISRERRSVLLEFNLTLNFRKRSTYCFKT